MSLDRHIKVLIHCQQHSSDCLLFGRWRIPSIPLCIESADRPYRIQFCVYDEKKSFVKVSNIASIVYCLLYGMLADVEAFLFV